MTKIKYRTEGIEDKLKENYIEAMKDETFKRLVKNLHISEDVIIKNTSKLKKTAKQLDKCKHCKNILECNNDINGFINYPEVNDGKLIFSYIPCKHEKKFIKETAYMDNIYSFDIPNEIINAKMKDIYTDDKNRFEVIKWLKDFILKYNPKTKTKGLYLHGNFGCGKTYLIAACFNELAKKGIKSAIIYWPEYLRSLKASFDNDFSSKFDRIKEVELLLIDDIGAENTTAWGRDEILGPILQYRMLSHLPTFFTSNLSFKELESHFSITNNNVDIVKARRIMERIKELTSEIKMVGENRRK